MFNSQSRTVESTRTGSNTPLERSLNRLCLTNSVWIFRLLFACFPIDNRSVVGRFRSWSDVDKYLAWRCAILRTILRIKFYRAIVPFLRSPFLHSLAPNSLCSPVPVWRFINPQSFQSCRFHHHLNFIERKSRLQRIAEQLFLMRVAISGIHLDQMIPQCLIFGPQ